MANVVKYIRDYLRWVDKRLFLLSALFIALLIYVNYHFRLQDFLSKLSLLQEYLAWYFIFLTAFVFPYVVQLLFGKKIISNRHFLMLLFIAPALFAWKMVYPVHFAFSDDILENTYWNKVVYWPFKLMVVAGCLLIIWRLFNKEQPFYGLSVKHFSLRPYFYMLLIMIPLIAAASTQHDFLQVYPKMMRIEGFLTGDFIGFKKLLYELSYGVDFISIELFFRGFLVLAFAKWVGKEAVLPMALFYCTIHFGKPLGECISSFFGGIILGSITYHTRSIYGGLIVHLGIAWLMELGGYIGHLALV
jgi:hypothetical protein